jgi:hypothetical protein
LAAFVSLNAPAIVYRFNLYPAAHITRLPSEGRTIADAATRWVELAEAGLPGGFRVETLTAK